MVKQRGAIAPLEHRRDTSLRVEKPKHDKGCGSALHAAEHTPMRKEICMTGDDTQGGIGQIGAGDADNQSS